MIFVLFISITFIISNLANANESIEVQDVNIQPISIDMSLTGQDTLSGFQGRLIEQENLVIAEPRQTFEDILRKSDPQKLVIPADKPFILPSEFIDQDQIAEMNRKAPKDIDDICASHRELDIGVLEDRIDSDPTVADLLDFAQERGSVEPVFAMEFIYDDGNVISLASLSDNAPVIYLISFGPMFEGKTILCEINTEGIEFLDREGSIKLPFDSRVPEVNVRERDECTLWTCVGGCVNHFIYDDPWINWLCGGFCSGCTYIWNPYICAVCAGCAIGIVAGCITNCQEDVCSYCDCPDPTNVSGEVNHLSEDPWAGVDVRLAHCDGTPFGPTMATTEDGFFSINTGGNVSEVMIYFDRHCDPVLYTLDCYSLGTGNNDLGSFPLPSCDNVAEVLGNILHENGSAWPDVEVFVTDCNWEETYDYDISDGSGNVYLEFPPGDVDFLFIRQECPGIILHTGCMNVSQGTHGFDFNLLECPIQATLTGLVLHEVNGNPWPGVTVSVTDCDYNILDQDDTDSQGEYNLAFEVQDFYLVFDRHCPNGELYGTVDCMTITPGDYTVSDVGLPECSDPVACFTWSPTTPEVGQQVEFDASCSYDPDGTINIYAWDFEADGIDDEYGQVVYHTYNVADTYTVNLWVQDNDGNSDDVEHDVTVTESGDVYLAEALTCEWVNGWQDHGPMVTEFDIDNTIYAYVEIHEPGGDLYGKTVKHEWWYNGDLKWEWTTVCASHYTGWATWTWWDIGMDYGQGNGYIKVYLDGQYLGQTNDYYVIPNPPSVTTNNATNIESTSVTLNGNLDDLGGASSCEVWFEWGLTTSYGNATNHQPIYSTGSFNDVISNLTSNTTYHFRAVAHNNGRIISTNGTIKQSNDSTIFSNEEDYKPMPNIEKKYSVITSNSGGASNIKVIEHHAKVPFERNNFIKYKQEQNSDHNICKDIPRNRETSYGNDKDFTTLSVPPIADAGGPYSGLIDEEIQFDASGSYDPNGTIIGYRWDWTNNGLWDTDWLSNPLTTHIYNEEFYGQVKLEAMDNDGFTGSDLSGININASGSEEWLYYKELTISDPCTDYQILLKVYKEDGHDDAVAGIIDCENHCNEDFSDIRFIANDQITFLPYWIEETGTENGDHYALIWVKTSGDNTIFMYYGNTEELDASHGISTFIFFDDFEGDDYNHNVWDTEGYEHTWTVSNSIMTMQSTGDPGSSGANFKLKPEASITIPYGHMWYSKLSSERDPDPWATMPYIGSYSSEPSPDDDNMSMWYRSQDGDHMRTSYFFNGVGGGSDNDISSGSWINNEWHYFIMRRDYNAPYASFQVLKEDKTQWGNKVETTLQYYDDFSPFEFCYYQRPYSASSNTKVDWVFVSKCCSPEPIWNSFGNEQQNLGNQPPNEPSNPSPEDLASNVSINTSLCWIGGDPDAGDIVTYDVYFSTVTPPTNVVIGQAETTYDPGVLAYETTYYWKIIAHDDHGDSTEGSIWSFTTGSWCGFDWVYRKELSISNLCSDYQMLIKVYKENEYDNPSSSTIDCEDHCNEDFSDIRFIASDQITLLPYWIEETGTENGDHYALIWVKTSGENSIFMYYGNSSASDASNGTNTFIFFDDFEGDDYNHGVWDTEGSAHTWTVSNSIMKMESTGDPGSSGAKFTLKPEASITVPYGQKWYSKLSSLRNPNTSWATMPYIGSYSSEPSPDNDAMYMWYRSAGDDHMRTEYNFNGVIGGEYNDISSGNWINNAWYYFIMRRDYNAPYSSFQVLKEDKTQWGNKVETTLQYYDDFSPFEFLYYQRPYIAGRNTKIDWVFVGKYCSTEPSWSSFGNEEHTIGVPENVSITVLSGYVEIVWDEVYGANSYKIYSSNDPYESLGNWTLEAEGITGTTWSEAITVDMKFYYVVASTETVRSNITKQGFGKEKKKCSKEISRKAKEILENKKNKIPVKTKQ